MKIGRDVDLYNHISPTDNSHYYPGLRSWSILFLLMFTYVISFIDRGIISLMVGPIKTSLGITDFQISLLQGLAFALFFCLVGLPIGWMVDRYRRTHIVAAGVTVWSLSASFCGLATSFFHLAIGRFGVGAGEAALSPAAYSMIADMFPRRRLSLAINIFAAGSTFGSALALLVGGIAVSEVMAIGSVSVPLLGSLQPWQLAFIVTGLPGLLVVPIYIFIREPTRRAYFAGITTSRFGQHLSMHRRYHISVFGGMALITVMAYGFGAWYPSYLLRVHHLGIAQVGLILGGICAIGGVSGYLTCGMIADNLFSRGKLDAHLRLAMGCAAAASITAVIGIVVLGDLASALVTAGLIYFVLPFSQALTAHLQLATPGPMRGRTSALYVFAFNLVGQAIGPSMVALFTDYAFGNPQSVGLSLALTFAIIGPLAIGMLGLGLASARRLILLSPS